MYSMAEQKISVSHLDVDEINRTFGEDFPLARLRAAIGRNSLVEIFEQIFHFTTTLPFGKLVADSQFGCSTVISDTRRHALGLKVLNRAMSHAMVMRVFCECDQLKLVEHATTHGLTIVKSSLSRRQLSM
jgi:hypothetical protein